MRSLSRIPILFLIAFVLLALGGKADAWARDPVTADAATRGGNTKPADPDEFGRGRVHPAGRYWSADENRWHSDHHYFFVDLNDLIDWLFGRKRPI